MKVLLVLWIVFGTLIFLSTTAQANQFVCPPDAAESWETLASVSRSCFSEIDRSLDGDRIGDRPKDESIIHTVQPTDSLYKIAGLYDTSIEALLLANPHIINPHLIRIDDELRIPTPEETERLRSEREKRRIAEQQWVVAITPRQGKRWVDVDLQSQTVRAYEGDTLVNTFIASTGTARYPTVTGQFRVWLKLEYDDMQGPGYHLKDVPYVMYFHEDYALHGTYWHNNFGTPMSHGCVNLRTEDAAWLYNFGSTGMLVNVH